MNQRSDIDRLLRHWMDDGPTRMPDRVIDVVADRISVQRQRRSWRLLRRLPMNPIIKLGAAAAAVLVVALVGWNMLPGGSGPGGPPSPTPSPSPTATPASSPTPLRDGALTEGRYQVEAFGLSIVADVPAGWFGDPSYPFLSAGEGFDEEQILITFMLVDGLFSDSCHWDLDGTAAWSQPGDVEVGPTVDDLVDALRANTSYTSSTPSAVTVGMFNGTELELQLPGDDVLSTCDIEAGDSTGSFFVFSGDESGGIYAQGPDNRWQLFIVDVEGTRLITLLSYFDGTPQADLEAARAIVESFEFTP